MKLTILTLCLCVLQVSASIDTKGQSFDLQVKDQTLKEVLRIIENKTNYRFFFNDVFTDLNRSVTINVDNKTIQQVMDELLSQSRVSYKVLDDNLIVIAPATELQQVQVSGKITDKTTGEPLVGVNVVVEGTTVGVVSDVDGKFSIDLPKADAVLNFSFVGYISMRVPVQGQKTVDIQLEQDVKALEEVVVVGYGTAKKSDVTGAIATVNQKTLSEVPVANVSQAMQGRVAGVQIQQTSTRPGDATQIRVRGTRSLSASNDPLLIVDGIPFMGTFNDINPGDIKSIDILKDASATAIYGSRGSNGVILITTNRGEAGKIAFKYNGYTGFGNVVKEYPVLSAAQYLDYKSQPGAAAFPLLTQEIAGQEAGVDTDWQDLMYGTSKIQSHDLSVSGGNQNFSGNTGLGYYNETAVMPGQGYKRFTGRMVLDVNVTNWFKFGLSSQNAFSIKNGENANNMFNMLANSPLVAPYDASGNIVLQPHYPREDSYSPLLDKNTDLWNQERKRFSTLNSAYAEIKFLPELKYRLNLGLNYSHDDYGEFYSSQSSFKNGGLSSASTSTTTSYNYAIENLLYFNKSINKHSFGVTLMQSVEDQYYTYNSLSGQNMTADYMEFYNMGMAKDGVSVNANTQSYTEKVLLSFMGRLNYSFDNKYLVTATFRSDGSSVLSSGHQWHTYPALALAWNVMNESFMNGVPVLSNLKLRAGYGQTSNQSVNPYSTLGGMSQNKYNFGTNYTYGYYVSSLGNPDVGWEYTTAYNAGIDWGLFDNRVTGSLDYYYQKTSDVLVQKKLLPSTGVSGNILTNVAETENKGFEVSVHSENFVPKENSGFSWSTDVNIGINRNKIVSLTSGQTQDIGNGWFVGQPIDVIYDYTKIGIWQTNEADSAKVYGAQPGDIKIKDLNGDRKIDATNDRSVIKKFEPDFVFGFTNRFSFKNFDLSMVTYGQVGGTLISTIHQTQSYLNHLDGRRNNLDVDYWTPDNPTNDHPRVNSGMTQTYYYTLGYFDASYWKIKTITLGYNIPERFLKNIKVSGLRVYAMCNNVATLFSPYMKKGGVDPQPTGYFSQENGGGIQQSRQLTVGLNTPPTRQFIFGVDLKF
jgi:TonB-linked SusC/RagA family outer membrane protein